MKKEMIKMVLYAVALAMGVATIVLSWTGLPSNYDTEPLLGIGILCLAIAGLHCVDTKKL